MFVNAIGEGGTLTPPDWRLFCGICAAAAVAFAAFFFVMFNDTVEDTDTVDAVPVS